MIEIHSIYGLCRPPDMALADIEHASIPETDTPGIIETNGSDDDDPTQRAVPAKPWLGAVQSRRSQTFL